MYTSLLGIYMVFYNFAQSTPLEGGYIYMKYTKLINNKSLHTMRKNLLIFITLIHICWTGFANENLFNEARALQREGKLDEAINALKNYLIQPVDDAELLPKELSLHVDALLQLMNTYQSKGEPEACVAALQEIFEQSPILQQKCLRDYNSIMGYALSRTERMKEAEETMLKALALPLYSPTPERYFRDYAYAAAVFYSNPNYRNEVINWCQEALVQADMCSNTSGKQWVTAMLGSLYKRGGNLNKALELYQQSKDEAQSRGDYLGMLNSLENLVDLFLYWEIPEYANIYATEAVRVEKSIKIKNPMVSAQAYINKGRALYRTGELDSISFYSAQARKFCETLPYNSGMVDIDLLEGIYMTEKGGSSLNAGIQELQNVTRQGTAANRAKAYHQLALTYLKLEDNKQAEMMLDSLYTLVSNDDSSAHILHLDYKPIIEFCQRTNNRDKADKYAMLLIQEQNTFMKNRVNASLVKAIVDFQTDIELRETKIRQLTQANQRLWMMIALSLSVIITFVVIAILFTQKKLYKVQIKEADEKVASLIKRLNESNVEKEMVSQEIKEFLKDKEKRQELETLTPYILKESGETKFRQSFELLYPLFLPRLREKVPSVSRREELLSMLIALKQDNKNIAELLAIAPRSVLMLRHRFRQKIGMSTEYSLENFIEDLLMD